MRHSIFLKRFLWDKVGINTILQFGEKYREQLVEEGISAIRSPISVTNPENFTRKFVHSRPSGSLKHPESIESVKEYNSYLFWWSREYSVRYQVCRLMRRLGEEGAIVEECLNLVKSPDASVRHSATYCLGNVTPEERTINILEELFRKDENQIVRYCASMCFIQISNAITDTEYFDKRKPIWPSKMRILAVLAILDYIGNNDVDDNNFLLRKLHWTGDDLVRKEIVNILGTDYEEKFKISLPNTVRKCELVEGFPFGKERRTY